MVYIIYYTAILISKLKSSFDTIERLDDPAIPACTLRCSHTQSEDFQMSRRLSNRPENN